MKRVRRLMASDLAYGLVLLVFVAAVVTWIYWPHGHARTVVRTTTTVVEVPGSPLTPLPRDSGPANNARSTTTRVGARPPRANSTGGSVGATPQNRPQSTVKTQKPKTTHKPSGGQSGSTAPQPSSPQPSPSRPVVGVTVPAPVTVCARPVATVNC